MTQRPGPFPVHTLRHLNAALAFVSTTGRNNCIQRSAALALDMPGSEIVFATFRAASDAEIAIDPRVSRVPFIHAWVEWRGWVFAPTTLERTDMRLYAMDREEYLRLHDARNVRVLPRAAFDRIARQHRLAAALKHGRARPGHGAFADALLNAAGVRYTVGESRQVLPVE